METCKKTTLLRIDGGEKRQEDCFIFVVCLSFPPLLRSRVVFLLVFISALFLYRSILTWNEVFRKFFPSFNSFCGVSKLTFKYNSFHSQYNITLQTNTFIANNEHVFCWRGTLWCWRQTCFVLETNTLVLETCVKNVHSNFSHIHTASDQRLSNRVYAEWSLATATYLRKRVLSSYMCVYKDPKGI